MKEQVSVDKAIRIGKLILLNSVLLLSVNMTIVLIVFLPIENPWIFFSLFFVVSPAISVLITVYLIKKWKYWAFGNVKNVHELKKIAITLYIISEKDKFFKNIERSSNNDIKHWYLKQKLLQEDVFTDDLLIPNETHIYHSKAQLYFFLFITLLAVVGLVYGLSDNILLSGIVAMFAIIVYQCLNSKKFKKTPQIIINDKGIETISAGFTPWEKIKNEQVYISRGGTYGAFCCLSFDIFSRQVSENLMGLNIGVSKLAKLLILYRNRYEQKIVTNGFSGK